MPKIKKLFIYALMAILWVALIVGTVLILPLKSNYVYANSVSDVVEEITLPNAGGRADGKIFNAAQVEKLISKILNNESKKTVDDIKQKLDTKQPTGSDLSLTNANSYNATELFDMSGGEFNVKFGNKQWTPTYLSYDSNGNVILTLWLTDSQSEDSSVKFNLWSYNSGTVSYPSSMYSSSYVRAYLNGTDYIKSQNDKTLTPAIDPVTQVSVQSNGWKTFKSIYDIFLVAPQDVTWQSTLTARVDMYGNSKNSSYTNVHMKFDWPNEACGTPKGTANYSSDNVKKLVSNSIYNDWGKDKLWLPTITETGSSSTASGYYGLWRCTENQLKNSTSNLKYWLRNGGSENVGNAIPLTPSGTYPNSDKTNTANSIRPALHLNLSAVEEAAVLELPEPKDITLDYNGSAQTVETAAQQNKADWYDETLYSDGVEITYSPEDTAKAQDYTVTIKITDEKKTWADAISSTDKIRTINMKINPGKITVGYSNSTELKEDNKFEFHAVNGQHILKFPESEYNWETRKIISLIPTATDEDKQSVEIWYYVTTHPENEHDDDAIESGTPNETDTSLWKKYEDSPSDSMFTASAPKGYCVYYMIKAANHTTKIGHFSVHIATEILTIYMTDYTLENKIYGQAPHTQDDLLALFQDKVDRIETAGGEQRKDDLTKPENVAKFKFYFTDNAEGTGTRYKTSDDGGGTTRWDVGKYYLQVRYTDGDESYITFKWGDGSSASHPTLTIEPKEVDLVWEGNSNWDSDKEKVSATVSEGNYTDVGDFNWVYDGEKHVPKAYFTDLNGAKIYVQVDGEKDNANMSAQTHKATAKAFDSNGNEIKNYKFGTTEKDDTNGGVEREFRINKAKNSWVERFYTNTLTINDDLNGKIIMPQATFGECIIKYYSQESDRQSQTADVDYPTQAEGTYYVRVTVEETSNYDGLDSISDEDFSSNYQFRVSGCNHLYTMWETVEEDPEWHMRSCTKCGETFKEKHSPKLKSGSTDIDYQTSADEHWQICKDCNAEFGRSAHSEHAMDGTKEPTCTDTGVSEGIECPVCGKVLVAQNVIPALGHRFGDDAEEVAATCTENGFRRGICQRCGNTATVVLTALGHTLAHHPEKEATETENGNIEYWNCSVCGKYFNDGEGTHEIAEANTVVPALGVSGGSGSQGGTTGGDSQGGNQNNNNLSDGLSGGSTGGSNDFLKDNWWWIVLIVGVLILLMLLFIIITTVNSRRRERMQLESDRERQRQFDTLIKMQMMHYGFGQGGYQAGNTVDETMHVEGQPRAQLPYSQEMIDVAVAAAMSALNQMNEKKPDTSASADSGKSVHDADGFYENYKPDDDNNK